jgi:hypothetical protein
MKSMKFGLSFVSSRNRTASTKFHPNPFSTFTQVRPHYAFSLCTLCDDKYRVGSRSVSSQFPLCLHLLLSPVSQLCHIDTQPGRPCRNVEIWTDILCEDIVQGAVILEKLIVAQLVKKSPASYVSRRFITVFTRARHRSLSWAARIQSTRFHPVSWRFVLILSSHVCLGLPGCLFPSGFPT